MGKYFYTWWKLTSSAAQMALTSRMGAIIFVFGKFLRFGFFFFFLLVLISRTKTIAGYSQWEIFLFYLTFQLVDVIPQFFLREVYRFRQQIVSGGFDYYLVKPFSPLFRSLIGGSDILDLPMLVLLFFLLWFVSIHIPSITFLGVILYILLIFNALLIAVAFHIFVLSLGILTTEVDNAIMLYRDITQMGRFPIDIYKQPLRGILTFAIPVGIMMTIPTKMLLGIFSIPVIITSLLIGSMLLSLSILLWKYALKSYSSASS